MTELSKRSLDVVLGVFVASFCSRMHCRVYAFLGFPILLTSSPPKDSEVEQSKLLARAAPALLKGKG